MTAGPKRLAGHLAGTKENRNAVFLVNRPDADVYLLAIDLDCEAGAVDGPARADALSQRIHQDLAAQTFMEPSRNGRGRYIWIRVRRSAGESVAEFTRKINLVNQAWSAKYGRKKDNAGVGFDAVKGAPWHLSDNPDFDPSDAGYDFDFVTLNDHNIVPCPKFLESAVDQYSWHKRHYKKNQFKRIVYLERELLHFGGLVTMPLHGVLDVHDDARWSSFFAWEADDTNIINSNELWTLAAIDTEMSPAPITKTSPVHCPIVRRSSGPWAMLTSDDKLASMNGAAALAVQNSRDASVEDVLALYRTHGAATGEEDTPARINRAAESLAHFLSTFDESKRRRPRFTDKDLKAERGLINGLVSNALLDEVNAECRSHIRRHRLPLYWLAMARLVYSENGGVAVDKLDGFLRQCGICLNGTELKSIYVLFERAHLFVCTKNTYQFFGDSKKIEGTKVDGWCKQWAFALGAILPRFLLPFVTHVQVGSSGNGRYLAPGTAGGADEVRAVAKAADVCFDLVQGRLSPSIQNLLFVVRINRGAPVSHETGGVGVRSVSSGGILRRPSISAWLHCAHA